MRHAATSCCTSHHGTCTARYRSHLIMQCRCPAVPSLLHRPQGGGEPPVMAVFRELEELGYSYAWRVIAHAGKLSLSTGL